MVKRNCNIAKVKGQYLFPRIARYKAELLKREPSANVISLGIGDTTEPLTPAVAFGMKEKLGALTTSEGYTGYGEEQGDRELRQRIIDDFYPNMFEPEELFIGDGSKPDIGRLQILFGQDVTISVQDPAYPVYVATSVMMGQTGNWNEKEGLYDGITPLSCTPENNFFPDLNRAKRSDLVFFCSPNNPTGAVPTHKQLQDLVDWARANQSIIIYDSAYAGYIRNPALPRTIYEIEGAKECVIETGSLSKLLGFTGVRLGWTIVPKELCFDDGSPVIDDWRQVSCTFFNGACNLAEAGAKTGLSLMALPEARGLTDYYMENAALLKSAMVDIGYEVYSGDNAPFLWVRFPGRDSWEVFEELLNKKHLVTTPGAGFGASGEGFVRFSAFGNREQIREAAARLAD